MIEATVTIVPGSASAEKGSEWRAVATFAGATVEAVSRVAPIYDLCRALKAAGCPDVTMAVRMENRMAMVLPSIHRAAALTIRESPEQRIRQAAFRTWAGPQSSE